MNKIALLFIFVTSLYGQNPSAYAALGDTIYDNVDKIDKLKQFDEYKRYMTRIQNYVQEVNASKAMGFKIEQGDSSVDPKIYLNKLRSLSRTNDFFLRDINIYFQASMKDKNFDLFLKLLDTGLIDTQKYKSEILAYYDLHKDVMEPNEVIQGFLDERLEEIALQEQELLLEAKKRKKTHIPKVPNEQKIQRLRKNDKAKDEMLQKQLEQELQEKKREILEEQKRELSR